MGNENKQVQSNFQVASSPNGRLRLHVGVNESARVWYELYLGETVVVHSSTLALFSQPDTNLLHVTGEVSYEESTFDETWEQPWGVQQHVRNNYTELALHTPSFTVRFRLFDDGLGFRYELQGEGELTISAEETEFNVNPTAQAWWIPALGGNHYEHLYKKTALSHIDTAHTPLTIELQDNLYLAIHEAALYNYGAMNIVPTERGLQSKITPRIDELAAKTSYPFTSPWRTIIVSETSIGLTTSRIMLNLNEPSKIADTSWIQPTKFMGIWWGMFIGLFTWESGDKHGATTLNAFRYINAAKKLGISALLIEGWNEGWDGDWIQNGDIMNHLQPYPDFDIHSVTSYAKSQGVEIVGHHETSGSISRYESQLPEAYDYYKHLGVQYIKTGYVNTRLDTGDFHSSQVGVTHYQHTVEMAAERHIMLDIHEPVKGTGIERTWPNLLTREGVMGQEYEGGAVSPEHVTVLPFTRLLAGPLDYTPGLFNLKGTERIVQSTLAKQLAFYVVLYSPMQMVADLPEHYFDHPAFQFIKDVPVDWHTSVPLEGVIGDFYSIARKDRATDDWYIGGVADEQSRDFTITLDFLDQHRTYQATVYKDAGDTHYLDNPEAYEIETQEVTHESVISVKAAPGGGFAIRVAPTDYTPYPYPHPQQ